MSNRMLNACWPLSMPPPAKMVLVALADAMNDDDGLALIAVRSLSGKIDLATKTSLGERTIWKWLDWLEHTAHVIAPERVGRGQGYRLDPCRFDLHDVQTCTLCRLAPDARCSARGARSPARGADTPLDTHTPKKATPSIDRTAAPRKRPLANDWKPSPLTGRSADIADAWTADRAVGELDNFKNYHASKGSAFADWDAAWRTWVVRSSTFERTTDNGTATGSSPRGNSMFAAFAERAG